MLVKLSSACPAPGLQPLWPQVSRTTEDFTTTRCKYHLTPSFTYCKPALPPDPLEIPKELKARNPARTMSEASLATSVPARREVLNGGSPGLLRGAQNSDSARWGRPRLRFSCYGSFRTEIVCPLTSDACTSWDLGATAGLRCPWRCQCRPALRQSTQAMNSQDGLNKHWESMKPLTGKPLITSVHRDQALY